mmetsp:Transcript_26819/g.32918  ORF Transcript_26819/g.32918 Transcript_26819/m.32918 type:complete len:95 (+) Transcript_26819:90-374(+)
MTDSKTNSSIQYGLVSLKRSISTAESDRIFRENDFRKLQSRETSLRSSAFKKQHRRKREYTCQAKHKNSPFLVDLVAENERIDEENTVRLRKKV